MRNPRSFKGFWSVVDKKGTAIRGNSKPTWYEREDNSLHPGSLPWAVIDIVCRADLGVNAMYLIQIPR